MKTRLYVASVLAGLALLVIMIVVVLNYGRHDPSPPSLRDHPNPAIPGKVIYVDEDQCIRRVPASGGDAEELYCLSRNEYVSHLFYIDDQTIGFARPDSRGEILYEVNGGNFDWMYGEQAAKAKVFSFSTEFGGSGFWPDPSERDGLIAENMHSVIYLTQVAGPSTSTFGRKTAPVPWPAARPAKSKLRLSTNDPMPNQRRIITTLQETIHTHDPAPAVRSCRRW